MSLVQILILAVVQGIAEFFPISSSGHLVIVDALLGQSSDIADVNIVLHGGTLASILVFYWHQFWRLLGRDRLTIPRLIVATLPVVVVGLVVKLRFGHWLESPLLAGCMLWVTAAVLFVGAWVPRGEGRYQQLGYGRCFLVGLAQAIAVLPGVSRSGSTISAGLAAGLSRADAATFSFLLAIPAMGGATVLELKNLLGGTTEGAASTAPEVLLVGAAVAFVVGLGSLWGLLRWLERGRIELFGYWCLLVGTGVVVWQLWG